MASNPNVNKVVFGNDTVMDITDTTAEAADVAEGKVFYAKSGARTVGTAAGGGACTVLTYGVSTYAEVAAATLPIFVVMDSETGEYITAKNEGDDVWWLTSDNTFFTITSSDTWSAAPISSDYYTKLQTDALLADKVDTDAQATDSTLGLIKLNSAQSIGVNASGQLTVGGRLGQFPDGGGVYYPATIEPAGVGPSSFLMTDGAKSLTVQGRTFGIMAGVNLTCKNTAAGSTVYRASNSQTNRFICAAVLGGRAALSQADATENGTAAIVSIQYANGTDLTTPYFGATESSNDIIITLERTVNPDAATKALRLYGTNKSTDNILVGQGVAAGGGKALSLGQATFAGGNQCIAFGNSAYVNANNSVGFGHTLLINKQFCFGAGQGHDFTNGANGTAALGTWSEIGSTTKLAVGDGTAFDARSNIFEVRSVSGASQLVIKSPNGTKFAISVDDSGNLTTTQL